MRVLSTLVVALLLGTAMRAADEPPALAKARMLYNAGSYDEAIAAASEVRATEWLAAAQMVMARSYLDRYRRSSQPDDLVAGRRALAAAAGAPLTPRDRVDLLVGLGQSLYFSDEYGAAAGVFDNALAQGFLLNRHDRLLLLDWWATAEDRAAQAHVNDRQSRFEGLRRRMEEELRRDAENPIANAIGIALMGEGAARRPIVPGIPATAPPGAPNLILMRNHGALTVGETVDEALSRLEIAEHLAATLLLSERTKL